MHGQVPANQRLATLEKDIPVADSALRGYFPDPAGTGVRVGEIRGGGAEVSDAQVVIADQLELALVRLVRVHAAIVAWLARGLVCPPRAHGLLSLWLAGLRAGDVVVPGLRMRVMPRRVLAHGFPPLPAV